MNYIEIDRLLEGIMDKRLTELQGLPLEERVARLEGTVTKLQRALIQHNLVMTKMSSAMAELTSLEEEPPVEHEVDVTKMPQSFKDFLQGLPDCNDPACFIHGGGQR